MIDFTDLWFFIMIFVLVIPVSIAFVFYYAINRNIGNSIVWSSAGMMMSLIICLEFGLAESVMLSVPGLNSPAFLSIFIGILAGALGLVFTALTGFILRRTSTSELKKIGAG